LDNRIIDHEVCQALINYSERGMGGFGNTEPSEIRGKVASMRDQYGNVAVMPLFQWLKKQHTNKLGGYMNTGLTRFKHLVSRAARPAIPAKIRKSATTEKR